MRRMTGLFLLLVVCLIPAVAVMAETISEYAPAHKKEPVWIPMEATAYCSGEITADGSRVREGICAAKKEWIGMTAAVYLDSVTGGVYKTRERSWDITKLKIPVEMS